MEYKWENLNPVFNFNRPHFRLMTSIMSDQTQAQKTVICNVMTHHTEVNSQDQLMAQLIIH